MIIATAGHVDHGKTSLVRNLTGVETDRLEEEKRRGLSINLGYAYKNLDENVVLGFIDVPGHRRFINTMISGISGIDLGMLVVAADDGSMPQTLEHLQVMKVLGVNQYVLVISKIDRVDEHRAKAVEAEVSALLPKGTPAFRLSNSTGEGVDLLEHYLAGLVREKTCRNTDGLFRLSIDRAFYMKGSGLVVTGTVASGAVEVGDTLRIQPQNKTLRVRGIHAQGALSNRGSSGQRCALNVSGDIHRDDIERGDWLVDPESLSPSQRFDARIHIFPDAGFGIKHMSQVKIHLGAKCLPAKIALLQPDNLLFAGENTLAQIIAEKPVLCSYGDKFLIQDYGETAALGGGLVLDPYGPKRQRKSEQRLQYLSAIECDELDQVIEKLAFVANEIVNIDNLLQSRNWRPGSDLPSKPSGIRQVDTEYGRYWLSDKKWDLVIQHMLETIRQLLLASPEEKGIKPAQFKARCKLGDDEGVFQPALVELIETKRIRLTGGLLCTPEHKVKPSEDSTLEWSKLLTLLRKAGHKIPSIEQLKQSGKLEHATLQKTINLALREKRLIKVSVKRVALPETLKQYALILADMDSQGLALSVINFRDRAECGRSLAIEILEFFDGARYTRRVGDKRLIIDSAFSDKL